MGASGSKKSKRSAIPANPMLAELQFVLRTNPGSKFIREVLRQILADNRVTPQELVRLRQAVLLEQALDLARSGHPIVPAVPAKNELSVEDPQAEALLQVHAFLASYPADARALELVARVLEDGVVTEEELALVSSCAERLDHEARMKPFRPERPAPEPSPQSRVSVPSPALEPKAEPEAPKDAYRWKFPEPKFFPTRSSPELDED